MELEKIINDKSIKSKEKTETISKLILDKNIEMKELIKFAKTAKDSPKATCIEAMEFATKIKPSIATLDCLNFVSDLLTEKAPRVKWESAKVIGNIAHLFPDKLDAAIKNLLTNTDHTGTVVRWSAAFALGQIIKTKHKSTKDLIPVIEKICEHEEKNSIRKIYIDALKKASIK
ncbi:MAG: hypothetical protein ABI723_20755 [Bacteroidia bacterium]